MGIIRDVTGLNSVNEFGEALIEALTEVLDKDAGTNLRKLYVPLAEQLATVDIETSAVKHDNYISIEVLDEFVTRDSGAGDRLVFEGAFTVDRIGFTETGFIRSQVKFLNEGDTTAILSHIPLDPTAIRIFEIALDTRADRDAAQFVSFSEIQNEVTFTPIEVSAQYFIEYEDSGTVLETTEFHDAPLAQYALGFGENGYSFFGFGE